MLITERPVLAIGVPEAVDDARRELRFDAFPKLTGDELADMAQISTLLGQAAGKRLALACPIGLKP